MKKIMFLLCLVSLFGVAKAQENKTYPVKTTVKSADSKGVPAKTDKNQQEVSNKNQQPVIIQTLEYKVDENGNATYTDSNIPVNTSSSDNTTTAELTVDEKIANIDANILAIDTKVEMVKSNPKKHQNALDSGWYIQMEEHRKNLVSQKEELLKTKK